MVAMVSAISPRHGLVAPPLKGAAPHVEAPAASPASTALAPVAPVLSARGSHLTTLRPDPSFVVQLIATATVVDDDEAKAAILRTQLGVTEPGSGAADPAEHGRVLAGIRYFQELYALG